MLKEAIEKLASLIHASQPVIEANEQKYQIVPDGCDLKPLPLPHKKPLPYIAEAVTLQTAADLAQYVQRYSDPARTVAFADLAARKVTVVLDYHTAAAPSVCQHVAQWSIALSREVGAWTLDRDMTHKEFIRLLDARTKEIVAPEASRLMSLVESLELVSKSSVLSTQTRNGDRAAFKVSRETVIESKTQTVDDGVIEPVREMKIHIPITAGFGVAKHTLDLTVHWDTDAGLKVRLSCHDLPELLDAELIAGVATLKAAGITVLQGAR